MRRFLLDILLVFGMINGGCRTSKGAQGFSSINNKGIQTLILTSSAFQESEPIPKKYTCDEADTSPDLIWSGLPAGVKSMALIMDDPDAPAGIWVHWVLFNIPAQLDRLPENVEKKPTVEEIGVQGSNSSGNIGYNGPCPPEGTPHHYFFKMYALDMILDLKPGITKAELENAMKDHILAQGQIVGTYER
jgi:Raf kinase inhibitor-like YbhB/YbcL family protein